MLMPRDLEVAEDAQAGIVAGRDLEAVARTVKRRQAVPQPSRSRPAQYQPCSRIAFTEVGADERTPSEPELAKVGFDIAEVGLGELVGDHLEKPREAVGRELGSMLLTGSPEPPQIT